MSYQPKINNTQQYSDSQGEHIVCTGRLLLASNQNEGKIAIGKSTESKKGVTPDNKVGLHQTGQWDFYNPIIISETEEIEVGDKYLEGDKANSKFINTCNSQKEADNINSGIIKGSKILALPEHFFDEHLQAIVDGKIKDGDSIFIKCRWSGWDNKSNEGINTFHYIDLNQQNQITLFPAKQSLEKIAKDYYHNNPELRGSDYFMAGAEWAKENNY